MRDIEVWMRALLDTSQERFNDLDLLQASGLADDDKIAGLQAFLDEVDADIALFRCSKRP